ncbi:hypothetical protein J6590_093639 [Homalodisca vitripennis]|nr:hypothetical protein J6590_093639 [Homalodisca vitripennis]
MQYLYSTSSIYIVGTDSEGQLPAPVGRNPTFTYATSPLSVIEIRVGLHVEKGLKNVHVNFQNKQFRSHYEEFTHHNAPEQALTIWRYDLVENI